MYLSLLPQFITPGHGSVLTQSLALGGVQISISLVVNALIAVMAGSISPFLSGRPLWLLVQRWMMGSVLTGLAVRMAYESRK
jgi:threonine/homoserine/homoserine lactone efflux protein